MTYYFRPPQITELEAIQKIAEQTFRDTYTSHFSTDNIERYIAQHFQHEMIKEDFYSPDNQFFIVEVRNEIVAYAKLKKGVFDNGTLNRKALEIERFYVEKSFQGEEIGSRLMTFCREWAELNHFEEIRLGVWANNEKAVRFYEKMGFEVVGEQKFIIGLGERIDYEMKQKITIIKDGKTRENGY